MTPNVNPYRSALLFIGVMTLIVGTTNITLKLKAHFREKREAHPNALFKNGAYGSPDVGIYFWNDALGVYTNSNGYQISRTNQQWEVTPL